MTQWGLIDFSVLIRNVIISNAWVDDYLMGQQDNSLLNVIVPILSMTYII